MNIFNNVWAHLKKTFPDLNQQKICSKWKFEIPKKFENEQASLSRCSTTLE